MKPVPHFSVANIRISEQTTKFYLSFFYAKNAIPEYRTRLVLYYEKSSQAKRHSRALDYARHDNVVVDARNEWSLRALPLLMRSLHALCLVEMTGGGDAGEYAKEISWTSQAAVPSAPRAALGRNDR